MIDDILGLAGSLFDVCSRGLREMSQFRRVIEQEGGSIIRSGRVGLFVRPPSHTIYDASTHLYYHVRYGLREGTWYVSCSSATSAARWVWCDALG